LSFVPSRPRHSPIERRIGGGYRDQTAYRSGTRPGIAAALADRTTTGHPSDGQTYERLRDGRVSPTLVNRDPGLGRAMAQATTSVLLVLQGRSIGDESIDRALLFQEAVDELMARRYKKEGSFGAIQEDEESSELKDCRTLVFAVITKALGLDSRALGRVKTIGQELLARGIEPSPPNILAALSARPGQN